MLFGSLIPAASRLDLYPSPNAPYHGKSISEMNMNMNKLSTEVKSLCNGISIPNGSFDLEDGDSRGLVHLIHSEACLIYVVLRGLNLEDFKNKNPDSDDNSH